MNRIQGLQDARKIFNDKVDDILKSAPLGMSRCAADYGVYIWKYKNKDLVIMNLSTDDFLIATKNEEARELINNTVGKFYKCVVVNKQMFHYLNWRII